MRLLTLEESVVELLELGAGQSLRQILALEEGFNLDLGRLLRGESALGALNLPLQFTHGLGVSLDVDTVLLVVLLDEVIDHAVIEIFTTEMSVTSGSQDPVTLLAVLVREDTRHVLEDTLVNGENGDIEGTST